MTEVDDCIKVTGARRNNLQNVSLSIPRNSLVVFTGVSGSGKSSLAFGTIYAEAQRRYFESVAPYARRLLDQLPAPKVSEIRGLPPAVALQQRRGEPTVRSSVGTVTTLSNSLRMLFSRAGTYPPELAERLDSDEFSPNTAQGACPACHGVGVVHDVTEETLVPDANLTIREGAIAAWPGAWQGKNLRDILAVLGYDIDKPWRELGKNDRDWILFTDEKPVVTVHAVREAHRIQRPYQGTYMSAAHYVRHTFANTNSESLRKRAASFMEFSPCTECGGKKLTRKALSVKFAGRDIAEMSAMPLSELAEVLRNARSASQPPGKTESSSKSHGPRLTWGESSEVGRMLKEELLDRLSVFEKLGLGYLSMDRNTPSLSSGELQRLRLATQLRGGLFGVVYVLDEPSAGLHLADTESLMEMLFDLKAQGNSLIVVEHEMEIVRRADWLVDIGPDAGPRGGQLVYSGAVNGLSSVESSHTRQYLFQKPAGSEVRHRVPSDWLKLSGINRHNLANLHVEIPLSVLTAVTGVSGAGKTTLVCGVLADAVAQRVGEKNVSGLVDESSDDGDEGELERFASLTSAEGLELINRLVKVDQKPIGRTPRSNLATYTGIFDVIRQRFAATEESRARGYKVGRFSFNVDGGRCDTCLGEGFVSVELLFLPSVYSPCSDCGGTRYNHETLEIKYRGKNIAQILDLTVEESLSFFADDPALARSFKTLVDVGLGYLRTGQPATELSGGEAQRIKLSTELQRTKHGHTLYILDEPTTGLHPFDVERLMLHLSGLVDAGNTVVIVEHDIDVIASCDWVIDLGPGGGSSGGKVVFSGVPEDVSDCPASLTGKYLAARK